MTYSPTLRNIEMNARILVLAFVTISIVVTRAQDVTVKIPGWDGAPVGFEVQERFLVQKGNRAALDMDVATDGAPL